MAKAAGKYLEVQEKKELVEKEEKTVAARYFVPNSDIYETEDALTVVMEVPGVTKDNVNIDLENDLLAVEGRINFSSYAELDPVYSEYNVGHFTRKFSLSSKIDQGKISAELSDGVLKLVLPKAEEAKPRRIKIS
jgi:HSP20 family protein